MPDRDPFDDERVRGWLAALDERHLANLTTSETVRALRALSSCYVERRSKLAEGGALNSAGKRAAFALFYAPQHFLAVASIVRALALGGQARVRELVDLGCGTGAAGAAWALALPRVRLTGVDRNAWAVGEAGWTYARLGLTGRGLRQDVARAPLDPSPGRAVLAAYTVNELPGAVRDALLPRLTAAHAAGAQVLIVEPVARRLTPWWSGWEAAFTARGGRADDWRFDAQLPPRQRELARGAGLSVRELTARSLYLPPAADGQ